MDNPSGSAPFTIASTMYGARLFKPSTRVTYGGFKPWWGYLLLYNLMFLIPLLLIFTIALYSIKMQLLTRMSKINVVVSKTFMGLFFLVLAALIGYFEFYR